MNSTNYRRPGAFSPHRPSSPGIFQGHIPHADRSESDSSGSSYIPGQTRETQSPQPHQQSQLSRPSIYPNSTATSSSTSVNNFSRPSFQRNASAEHSARNSGTDGKSHRRQHSQGFFEPTLPTATLADQSTTVNSAAAFAAQAAMQHQSTFQHSRQRSQTIPSPQNSPPGTMTGRRKPPPIQTANSEAARKSSGAQTPGRSVYNGAVGGHSAAATTAANAAFPRSPQLSPALPGHPPEKEHKLRSEKSKMKLFSKPKDKSNKEADKDKPLPSPNKTGAPGTANLSKMVNPSVTSLADSLASGTSSIYSMTNASTSTLVPPDRQAANEKEKAHKHHFLSRQKNKLKDRIADDHAMTLSSASSNSKLIDPSAPSSIYNFGPAPASPAATSFSGFDIRHGGRALREKKKEEKSLPFAPKKADLDKADWMSSGLSTPGTYATSVFGPPSGQGTDFPSAGISGFGLNNMRPEDAWDFLRAKLLVIFERNEELPIPVEDLNRLVSIHIKRCIVKRLPTILLDDLRSLLQTGFISLDYTLRSIPDHRLVPHLVDMWLFVFGTVLPYMQAVFLPLDLEFKGHGTLLSPAEAADFWGANPDAVDDAFGNEFDVRRITLLSYRDHVILAHYDALLATFSRLSLDSINVNPTTPINSSFDDRDRPGTAGSLDPGISSFNSQTSTLVSSEANGRSRAASNLSAPELPSFSFGSPSSRRPGTAMSTQHPDSAMVTETVGRMLQCVSVLASVQSGDEAQTKMEDLAKALKLNWLGRGRTGRNRRGFVGGRVGVRGAGGGGREGASML